MTGDKPLKILHVDDEKNQLEFTKLFLEEIEKDVVVDSVNTPEEALKKQAEENYDCIVSDYKMMSMNGIELAQKVREKSDVPFILYTGQGSEEVAELAFSAGVDDYMRKETEPTHYQILAKRIRQSVEKHRTEELYRKVVEESRDAIIIVVDNKVAFLNSAACNMVGLKSSDECIGRDIFEFFVDGTDKIFLPKPNKKGNYIIKLNYKTKNGALRNAEVSLSKINYQGDEAFLCFIRDITDRKRNEERLNAIYQQATRLGSAMTIQEISETTLDIMESVFEYHTLTFHLVERKMLRTLGTRGKPTIELSLPLTGPGIMAKAARESQSVLIADVSKCSDFVKGTTEAGSELAVPAVLNEETVAVLNVESKEKNDFTEDDKRVLEMLAYHVAFAFNRIQTEALREEEGEEKQKRLDYALNVLDNAERTTSLVSERLQKNIISILNAAGILRIQHDKLDEIIDTIDKNVDEAQHISEVIKDMIAQTTIIEGFIEVNKTVKTILEKQRFPRNIRVNTQYHEELLIVEIEEEKFARIINNLLRNAVEAMPSGGTLSVKVTRKEEEAYIDISDKGSGIPEAMKKELFKPFHSSKKGHSGLGLAFSKNAVESEGGSLNLVYSNEKGTTFRLVLPIRKIV